MGNLRPQQRFAAHERQHTTPVVMEPVNGALGDILGHALHLVIEGPAVPAIEIALVIDEEISGDGMEFARHHPRSDIRNKPAANFAPDLFIGPIALFKWNFRARVSQQLGILRENRFRLGRAPRLGGFRSRRSGVH